MTAIIQFRGKYDFLSNFYPCKVTYDGITYPSVENAFQAAKSLDKDIRNSFVNISAAQAKRMGRHVDLRDDWDNVKIDVMKACMKSKFESPSLAKRLIATGDRELIEGNTWGDTYWGQVDGKGANIAGKLLMEIRDTLRCPFCGSMPKVISQFDSAYGGHTFYKYVCKDMGCPAANGSVSWFESEAEAFNQWRHRY